MNSEQLDQFTKKIQEELLNAVNNSKLVDLLDQYGLTEDGFVTFQCRLDIPKIQLSDAVVDQQLKESLRAIRENELIISACDCWCLNPPEYCCKC
jgi:DNA-directed RNA polymerase specialized sigma subunit